QFRPTSFRTADGFPWATTRPRTESIMSGSTDTPGLRGVFGSRGKAVALLAVATLTVVASSDGALAQQSGTSRTDLQRHDLSVPGREAIQVLVEFAPGAKVARHSHPGEELVYVVEGSLEYRLDGKPPVTLEAGEVLFVPAGAVHA